MAKRRFTLTPAEVRALWQAYDSATDPQAQRRWQAVRLYGEGRSVRDIQTITVCSETSLRRWARLFRQQGIDGLRAHWHGGNRALLSAEQRADLKALMQQTTPEQVLGSQQRARHTPFWTVEDVQVLAQQRYGVVWQSRTSYITLLHACGLSVQRVSKQFRSRPDAQGVADASAALEKK